MKYIVIYKIDKINYIVGFTNSKEEFFKNNDTKAKPLQYPKENFEFKELTEQVFIPSEVEGTSEFNTYLNFKYTDISRSKRLELHKD